MTDATRSLQELVSHRFATVRDKLVSEISSRHDASTPDTLVDISEAVRSVISGVDEIVIASVFAQDQKDSVQRLSVKRSARALVSVKVRNISFGAAGKSVKGIIAPPDKETILEGITSSWPASSEGATFVSDLKDAISSALGQS